MNARSDHSSAAQWKTTTNSSPLEHNRAAASRLIRHRIFNVLCEAHLLRQHRKPHLHVHLPLARHVRQLPEHKRRPLLVHRLRAILAAHPVCPVRLEPQVDRLYSDSNNLFLEVQDLSILSQQLD
jgi:hypothetical protein